MQRSPGDSNPARGMPSAGTQSPQMRQGICFEADVREGGQAKRPEIKLIDEETGFFRDPGGEMTLGQGQPRRFMAAGLIPTIHLTRLKRPGNDQCRVLINDRLKTQVPLRMVRSEPAPQSRETPGFFKG